MLANAAIPASHRSARYARRINGFTPLETVVGVVIRDNKNSLELNVVDNYQAGEIRSSKNLSDGESFIVGPAPALALSQVTGKNVRADSLFFDEGFGTLDEEALYTALETLAGL